MKLKSGEIKRESTGEKVDNSKKLCGQFSEYLRRGIHPAIYLLPRSSKVSSSYGAGCRIFLSRDRADVSFLPGRSPHYVAVDDAVFFKVEPFGCLTASTVVDPQHLFVLVFPALKKKKKIK